MINIGRLALLGVLVGVLVPGSVRCEPIRIGSESRVRQNPRSQYSRYVNWRPADGETVNLNPPRISWPYSPDWPDKWSSEYHAFRLQISSRPDCSKPVVDVACGMNFYNCLPELKGASQWYWRVGYDVGTPRERWSAVRSFSLAERAAVWGRAELAQPDFARRGHPRVLFNGANLDRIRRLQETNPASKEALEWMRQQADRVLAASWWNDFPTTDREDEPRTSFYAIAHDLALVAFVYCMTGDEKYAGVKERAVTWASYPPGGRSSPEGLGGDGSEDATQGNEFLALLFDWLYQDLSNRQRQIMIDSLAWRVDHIMNSFAWRRLKPDHSGRRRLEATATVPVSSTSLSGLCSSHQYEGSMDTAVCGLVLYEHCEVGRQWYALMVNYLIGVTCGHGFDECWNEGPGYGTSKCKWLTNASLYFDTAIADAHFGRNPFYSRIGEYFRRVIPVGMDHNAWGNQKNASRGNHLAMFRKLAYLTGDGQFLFNYEQYRGRAFSKFRPWIEYVLPAYYDRPEPMPEREPVALFDVDGWAMAATGPPSDRSTYENGLGFIFQCRPRGGFSHSFHSDASFQLHAYGQMLNHGGGSSANGDAFAYHTMSHNTILVDGLGQAQTSKGQTCPAYGRIVGFARGKDFVHVAGDATHCYPREPGDYRRWSLPIDDIYRRRAAEHLQRFVRHILFMRGKYFIIYDDLAASQPTKYTWLYHILPEGGLSFDRSRCAVDYHVGDVKVRLQHIAQPRELLVDDRRGLDGFINPVTGEDYRRYRRDDVLCEHNLWVTNERPAMSWSFLSVIYPIPPGGSTPRIDRIDDYTVRVGQDVISFDPGSAGAAQADLIVDRAAFHTLAR
jgi:hypothetical protein